MRKITILTAILLISCFSVVHSQTYNYTETELEQKCDSILQEGNLLYRYEKAAWIFSDMYMNKPEIMGNAATYLTYEKGDSIKCILIDKEKKCNFEVSFVETSTPCLVRHIYRDLSNYENNLLETRTKILRNLVDNKYDLVTYDGYSLNWILLPFEEGYKFYAINGTQKAGEVPIGNDYLFITNKEGEIQSWKKFHSRLIPIDKGEPGGKHIHSHLRQEPFISATDICTFKLYQNQVGLTSFGVYSPSLDTFFVYQLETNSITISKDPNDLQKHIQQ
ncbi:hypothetical protein [Bacteroides sp.]|uniref:hypothetical protein n=1 Tax=Bacteroides sp. TaxID=29523 RepID=UPI00261AF6CF|nr:hypothetical protein [Bacteroides sp.]MDD3037027.1 hypothetical protein [Bacteroides sp.]